MPVRLTVREVRDALMRADAPGDGEPSHAAIGGLFHQAFADMIATARESGGFGDSRTVVHRAYEQVVGPFLTSREGSLQTLSAEVIRLWRALESLVEWLASLDPVAPIIDAERPVIAELREPSWTDSVVLAGVADALVSDPKNGRWCVVELKLGRSHPRADLGQAALYQIIREANDPNGSGNALALLSFGPDRQERLFRSEELAEARPALLNLIGRLAGVLPTTTADPEAKDLGDRLIGVLAEYRVEAELVGPPIVGPGLIRFRINPGPGVKVAALEQRVRELRMRLVLDSEPAVGIEGGMVTIDLPRRPRQVAPFAEFRRRIEASDRPRIPVGVGLDGTLAFIDLTDADQAHCLVAGKTGSGKSEWLRAAIAGLIVSHTPETLRLLLIDPKRTAFGWLRDSPFLLRPTLFPDAEPIEGALRDLIEEMEGRYRRFAETGADDIQAYNAGNAAPMPRIVCVCDEYAALLHGPPKHVKSLTDLFIQLGARARAAGIHLILATQQPSRETLKGPLVTNLGVKVGLKMTSPIESRMLLNEDGAELLMGGGDLLYQAGARPIRLQGLLLSPEERDQIGGPGLPFRPVD